ncbi:hypothetical protein DID78_02475 [Candidatus Marinamargulisbacteria bacterium SCGC AG-343-D04]|nr:hypothetical protein DID78_02475 [Candidatus Marinamargulisbacteria bacterium SCGC AG-343-D04]
MGSPILDLFMLRKILHATSRGFSLIELCITLSIMAFISPLLIDILLTLSSHYHHSIHGILRESEWQVISTIIHNDLMEGNISDMQALDFNVTQKNSIIEYSINSTSLKRRRKSSKILSSSLQFRAIRYPSDQCLSFIFHHFPDQTLCKALIK